jgi:hypothetical protein
LVREIGVEMIHGAGQRLHDAKCLRLGTEGNKIGEPIVGARQPSAILRRKEGAALGIVIGGGGRGW